MIHLETYPRPTLIRLEASVPRPTLRLSRRGRRMVAGVTRKLAPVACGVILGAWGACHFASGPQPAATSARLILAVPIPVARALPTSPAPHKQMVAIREGDTLWSLAQRYGGSDQPIQETVQQLMDWNQLGPAAALQPGKLIRVR